jgi:hypothetical protein
MEDSRNLRTSTLNNNASWEELRFFLNVLGEKTNALKALRLLALAIVIAVLFYQSLVPAISYIFPGASIPLPNWLASNAFTQIFCALLIGIEILNATIVFLKLIFAIHDDKPLDVSSALCAFFGSIIICICASLIAFDVAVNLVVIPSLFISALALMTLDAIFDYIAKSYAINKSNEFSSTQEKKKEIAKERVKLGLTVGLTAFGIVAVVVQLASIVTAGALVTIPISWALAGILVLIAIGLIVSKLVGGGKAQSSSSSYRATANLPSPVEKTPSLQYVAPSDKEYNQCHNKIAQAIPDAESLPSKDIANIIQFFAGEDKTLQNNVSPKIITDRNVIVAKILQFELPTDVKSLFQHIDRISDAQLYNRIRALHDVLFDKQVLHNQNPCFQHYTSSCRR